MDTDALGLGRLQRLADARTVWKHEAVDFTPWLAANIDVLSEAISLPLTVTAQEVLVGDFRLDIQAADPDGHLVIIENQLEPSNHLHLGQLLVYASGLEASTAVWITTRLRDEHRSALTWLNERTDSEVKVFGIELSVVQIGDSLRAPVLDVVVEPNNWNKATKAASKAGPTGPVSSRNRARTAFFEEVFDNLAVTYPAVRTPRPQTSNWSSFASGPFGYYSLTFSKQGYRVEVYLDTGDRESTKALFDDLAARRADIERRVGFDLVWDRLDANRGSRIATYFGGFEPDGSDPTARQEAVQWSVQRAEALHRTLDSDLRRVAEAVKDGSSPAGQ